MRKVVLWVLILILVWMLAACAPAAPQQDASQPAPTMPDEVESADDASPTSESPQTPPTETPLPEAFVEEKILIAAPGTNSSVTSPFVVEGLAVAPFESILGLRVTDANGVVLAEAYPQVNAQMGQTGPYQQEIVFSGVTEEIPGRLVVYTTSPRDGGLVHLSSVVIRLLPGGEAQISPSDGAEEKIQILSPAAGEAVSGGAITVTGNSAYFFEANLSLMLCAEGGSGSPHLICGNADSVLAEGAAMIDSPDVGIGGVFAGSLSYTVDAETPARLVVYALSPMDGGIEHLSSVDVRLTP